MIQFESPTALLFKLMSGKGKEVGVKLVCVGDGAIGKTCLMIVYGKGEFPTAYVPTIFENYQVKVKLEDQEVSVQLWDTAGQEELENIRVLSYDYADVFLLCFAVNDPASYENIKNKWCTEIRDRNKTGAFMIVGTKTDLRDEADQNCITPEEGQSLANQVGAICYMECSAKKFIGVKEVFDRAILEGWHAKTASSQSGGCCELQ